MLVGLFGQVRAFYCRYKNDDTAQRKSISRASAGQ